MSKGRYSPPHSNTRSTSVDTCTEGSVVESSQLNGVYNEAFWRTSSEAKQKLPFIFWQLSPDPSPLEWIRKKVFVFASELSEPVVRYHEPECVHGSKESPRARRVASFDSQSGFELGLVFLHTQLRVQVTLWGRKTSN